MKIRRSSLVRVLAIGVVGIATGGVFVLTAAPASAETPVAVAWTGIGIYPQSAPSLGSGTSAKALPDGAVVSVVCEQSGQAVGNGQQVSEIWDRLDDGSWLPNAFLNTGVDGWTPGVPRCGDIAPEAKSQMVDRSADSAAVASAVSSPCGKYIDHAEWIERGSLTTLSVTPTDCGRLTAFVNHQASFDELYKLVDANWGGDTYWSMHHQWTCHADWAPPYVKKNWNLDLQRPNVGYWETVLRGCNNP